MNRKKTAVISPNMRIFENWCLSRRIARYKSNTYIDEEGEIYFFINNIDKTRGINFNEIEETKFSHELENYDEIKESLQIRLIKYNSYE
tara:strand:- start:97 stop:363 length:267 start_codon:yes stop_codon:yes gene_type:complete